MITGLYSAVTGLVASEANHEVIAHNLAHVNVPGFRRTVLPYETFESSLGHQATESAGNGGGRMGAAARNATTDFTPGVVQQTGRRLDVAINGDAFFVVEGSDGPLYTRNGAFQLDAGRRLVTSDGRTVQGIGGPITLPADVPLAELTIRGDGTFQFGEIEIGRLQLASLADNSQLIRAGTTLFAAPDGVAVQPAEATVVQGARELANVQAVDELVRMIAGMRHYEASQRALKTLGDSIGHSTNPQAG